MNDTHVSLGAVRALWQDLLRGALRVVPGAAEGGFELLLAPHEPPTWTPQRTRRESCCQAVLRGEAQKAVAADFGVAPATLSGLLKTVLLGMGLDERFTRIPIAIPLLLHAAESAQVLSLCEVDDDRPGERRWRVSLSLPGELLEEALSEGERDVVQRYLTGQSYAEIAAARRSSPRTVANQLGLSFKKLRVSGRFSLIRSLVERGAARGTPITLTLRTSPESLYAPRLSGAPASSRALSA